MGYKTFSVALVLGLISTLPLACGSDDDSNPPSTAGKGGGGGSSGSAGKGGAGGAAGKGGAGTAGKAGAGTAGTSPGAAGEGGSGPTDNVGGEAGGEIGGAGGESAAGADSGGSGGEAGVDDAAAARLSKTRAVCELKSPSDGLGGTGTPQPCTDIDGCVAGLYPHASTPACIKALDDLLDCIPTADPAEYYCGNGSATDGTNSTGTFQYDIATDDKCPAVYAAWTPCLSQ